MEESSTANETETQQVVELKPSGSTQTDERLLEQSSPSTATAESKITFIVEQGPDLHVPYVVSLKIVVLTCL